MASSTEGSKAGLGGLMEKMKSPVWYFLQQPFAKIVYVILMPGGVEDQETVV